MNKNRWRNERSASRLVVKLAEETGEVAKAYLDVLDCSNDDARQHAKMRLVTELDHVIFISGCLRELVIDTNSAPIGAREEEDICE